MKQSHCPCGAPNANVDFDAAQAALEAAQADARRYRWLRETPGMGIDMMIERGLFNDNGSLVPLYRLDVAIDAAMKGESDA